MKFKRHSRTIKSFQDAEAALGSKDSKKLENNTVLVRLDENRIVVQLHQTNVVTYCRYGDIVLNSGGYRSATTKDRINGYAPCAGLFQKGGEWFLSTVDGPKPFTDGIKVYPLASCRIV